MVSWLYEYGDYRRFTHTVLLGLPSETESVIDRPAIELILQLLLDGHDTLRSILDRHCRGTAPGHPRARRHSGRRRAYPRAGVGRDRRGVVFRHADSARAVTDEIDPRAGP